MRDDRVNDALCEKWFCTCKDLQPCTCINYPPYHCGICGREFTSEQLSEARQKGWYSESSLKMGAQRHQN